MILLGSVPVHNSDVAVVPVNYVRHVSDILSFN